ncbi:hypothetical protein TRFO_16426 [Tritrichomonas foetus]|uniref:CKK domain-containing protein n=1 Tax=Tritrichomonas foetus TaxID=1144522 RepID=A0A1J4KUT8_9EUKA|nr:hypothetical protein TRFO_16426 [Tritrichomonas foetus]|eukprot:OHT13438.1 hypothetical protein TRFO_16426 [Tritrichomonas foetus]
MTYSSRQRREINNEYELFSGFTGRKVIGFTDIESPPKKYIKRNINKSELPEESRGKKNSQASKSKSETKSNISTQKTSESHHFREPLKTTNGQNKQLKINEKYDFDQCPSSPPKKKVTKHAAPLQGAVIQKVDYPLHKIKKQKKSPIKNNQENDLESQRLMELAAKYSQFLKERLSKNIANNSKPTNGNITDNNTATDNIQQQPTDKPIEKKRLVKFNDNIFKPNKSCLKKQGMSQNQNINPNNCQKADGSKANDEKRCKKLVIEPTITYSVDSQEVMFDGDSNDHMQKANNNVVPETNGKVEIEIKENHIETPRKPEVSNNTISDDNIETLNDDQQQNNSNDDIGDDDDDFVNLVPKKPPVPTRYDLNELQEKNECNLKNTKLVENESDCDHEGFISLYDLMKKKNELDQRLNNTLESPNKISSKPTERFNNSPVLDDADYVQLDMTNMQRATSNDENKEFSSKKHDKILINEDSLNPSDFFPKKRFFEMSDSDSENIASMTQSPKEKNDDNYPDVISSSPILSKIKDNIYSEPISNTSATKPIPRVTWDISNCPPPRARITNNFNHHIYDDDDYNNDYSNNYHQEEVDLNSVTDFSKAIKLPKDFIINFNESEQSYETLDNNSFSNRKYGHDDDDDDDDDFYFQDEEDRNDCIPNFSRMLSFLRHKLDTKQLAEVVEVMNQNKSKHFVLSISTSSQKIDAVYVLRSDLKFARLIWGEGLSKVFQDDVAIFYQLNIASKRFEPLKITEFTPDFDAFLID